MPQQQIYQQPVTDPQANYWGNPTNLGQQMVPDASVIIPSANHPIQRGLKGALLGTAAGSYADPYGGSPGGALAGAGLGLILGMFQNHAANKQRDVQQRYATYLQQQNNQMYQNNLSQIQQNMDDKFANEPQAIRQQLGYQDPNTGTWHPKMTVQNATNLQDARKSSEDWTKEVDSLEKRGQGPQITGFMSGAQANQQALPNVTQLPKGAQSPGTNSQPPQTQGQKADWDENGNPVLQANAQEQHVQQPQPAQNTYWNGTPSVSSEQLQESYGVPPEAYVGGLNAVTAAGKAPYQNYSELESGNRNQADTGLIGQRTQTEVYNTQLKKEEAAIFNKYRAAQIRELTARADEHARGGRANPAEARYLNQIKTVEEWRKNGQISDTEAQKLSTFPDSIKDISLQKQGYWTGKQDVGSPSRAATPKAGSLKTITVGKSRTGEAIVVKRKGH